ncbi:MAG: hypothetical protein HQ567_21275 [Candidatus Nealsonbacteria bacterium]|nr:hypothetical protein [Candidatus Nealsonbacteria bacterium]
MGSQIPHLPDCSIRCGVHSPDGRTQENFLQQGSADVSDKFSAHAPVLWDRSWRLRGTKNPTPGPYEKPRRGRGDRVLHRYIYDGQRIAQRETYRNRPRQTSPTETTRFIHTVPGGPTFFADSDATLDVDLPDRYGREMLRYRAREGNRWFGSGGKVFKLLNGVRCPLFLCRGL